MMSIYDSEEYSDVVAVMVKNSLFFWTHSLRGKPSTTDRKDTVSRHLPM